MKIVHIQHPYIPNMGYQENHLPRKQGELGHDVCIITSNINPKDRGSTDKKYKTGEFEDSGVRIIRLPPLLHMKLTEDVALKGLFNRIWKEDPDIVHVHGTLSPYLYQGIVACKILGIPLVVDDHVDDDNLSTETIVNKILLSAYSNIIFSLAKPSIQHYLPITNASKQFLTDTLDVDPSSQTILPLGVDTTKFAQTDMSKTALRSEYNIPEEKFVFITTGHLEPQKNIKMIINATASLIKHGRKVFLLIVGPGPDKYMAELRSTIRTLNIQDDVMIYGHAKQNEIVDLLNAADAGVWPGVGVSIIEAIGTGLPVIIGDNTATEHLVKSANGMVFHRDSTQDLRDKMTKYLENPQLVCQHSDNAVEYASEELSWEGIAKKSIDIYQNVTNS